MTYASGSNSIQLIEMYNVKCYQSHHSRQVFAHLCCTPWIGCTSDLQPPQSASTISEGTQKPILCAFMTAIGSIVFPSFKHAHHGAHGCKITIEAPWRLVSVMFWEARNSPLPPSKKLETGQKSLFLLHVLQSLWSHTRGSFTPKHKWLVYATMCFTDDFLIQSTIK